MVLHVEELETRSVATLFQGLIVLLDQSKTRFELFMLVLAVDVGGAGRALESGHMGGICVPGSDHHGSVVGSDHRILISIARRSLIVVHSTTAEGPYASL
eukprot:COSAG06_NODE_13006_length_1303_cov_1.364618_2_plen_100_part_00